MVNGSLRAIALICQAVVGVSAVLCAAWTAEENPAVAAALAGVAAAVVAGISATAPRTEAAVMHPPPLPPGSPPAIHQ